MTEAANYWKLYIDTAMSQYNNPVLLNRVRLCDWQALTKQVYQDIEIAKGDL